MVSMLCLLLAFNVIDVIKTVLTGIKKKNELKKQRDEIELKAKLKEKAAKKYRTKSQIRLVTISEESESEYESSVDEWQVDGIKIPKTLVHEEEKEAYLKQTQMA